MIRTIRYLFLILLTLCTTLFFIYNRQNLWQTLCSESKESCWIVLSAVVIYLIFLRKRMDFFENLLHELTHMLFSWLTFKKVSGLYVSATNGVVYTEGSQKNILVTLSPYFFPLLTILFLGLSTAIKIEYSKQIIIVSYVLFQIIALKHLIKAPYEISSTGVTGWLLLLILNFWMSYFILSWCSTNEFNVHETLYIISDGIKRTISQSKFI